MAIPSLFAILALVLVLPFAVKAVEENLEVFLFVMGALAVTVSGQWDWPLVKEGLLEPIKISAAVLVAGLLFKFLRPAARKAVGAAISALGLKAFSFAIVVFLGLVSSVITAIIAALLLVEVIDCMKLDRKDEIKLVVVSCFAIGIGAVLTPLGEPLSTIVIGKLRGQPYNASFWFLFTEFWRFVVPGVLGFGILAAFIVKKGGEDAGLNEDRAEGVGDVLLRTREDLPFRDGPRLPGHGLQAHHRRVHLEAARARALLAQLGLGDTRQRDPGRGRGRPLDEHGPARLRPPRADHRGRHAHPREHPQHHLGRQARHKEQGMDEGGAPDRSGYDGYLFRRPPRLRSVTMEGGLIKRQTGDR